VYECVSMPVTRSRPASTIEIQVRDHEYAPWRDVEVEAAYTRDSLGFLQFESSDGEHLKPVRHRDARQQNPGWSRGSLRRRWVRLPG